jgi:hypothetical protein
MDNGGNCMKVTCMKFGEKNVGTADRIVRIILGLILIFLGWGWLHGIPKGIVYLIGLILIVTGILGTCLIYSLLGMNTSAKKA